MLALALTLVVAAEPMKFDPNQNVQRHPDGGLWVGIASEKQTVRGVPIPKDSAIEFDESGGLTNISFGEDTIWSGLRWKEGEDVEFDEKGALVGGTCATEVKSSGLTFAAGKRLEFFPTRKGTPMVLRGTIAGAQTFGGLQIAADSEVVLNAKGGLEEAVSGAQQNFKGVINLLPKMRLTFHPNGMISSVTNDWGIGFYDEKGKHLRHKEYAK